MSEPRRLVRPAGGTPIYAGGTAIRGPTMRLPMQGESVSKPRLPPTTKAARTRGGQRLGARTATPLSGRASAPQDTKAHPRSP